MNNDYILYILMRTDLPSMSTGRAAAQASHAANAFIHKWGKRKDVISWTKQTKQGFGTAIVLSATIEEIHKTLSSIQGGLIDYVIDPDYVISVSSEIIPYIDIKYKPMFEQSKLKPFTYFCHIEEITCAYIFGKKEELKPYLEKFNLYP